MNTKKALKLGLILLVISVVSAGILSLANAATKDKIAEIELQITKDALSEIFGDLDDSIPMPEGEFKVIEEEFPDVLEIYEVVNAGETIGHSITLNTNGFSGPIELMIGFDMDGDVLGTRLLNHGETAGIGSKAAEPEFTGLFEGKSSQEEIEVETISGATITSEAVLRGVNEARIIYNDYVFQ